MRKLLVLAVLAGVAAIAVAPAFAATKSVRGTSSNRWSPSTLTVKKGDRIRFSWDNTGAPHDVRKTSGSGGRLTANTVSNKGSATFTVPSNAATGKRWRFICSVHADTMKLTATVR